MAQPDASMEPKSPVLRAPLSKLPLHYKGKPLLFFCFLVRDRRALRNTPLALLFFCSHPECDKGLPKDKLNAPALRSDDVFLFAPTLQL